MVFLPVGQAIEIRVQIRNLVRRAETPAQAPAERDAFAGQIPVAVENAVAPAVRLGRVEAERGFQIVGDAVVIIVHAAEHVELPAIRRGERIAREVRHRRPERHAIHARCEIGGEGEKDRIGLGAVAHHPVGHD